MSYGEDSILKIASVDIPRAAQALLVSDILIITAVFASAAAHFGAITFHSGAGLAQLVLPAAIALLLMLFILTCNFAMGLYQRRFMKGRKLLYSVVICAAMSLVVLLFVDNLFFRNSFRFSELATMHLTLYLLMGASRPLVRELFQNFVPKRRLAFVGSPGMAEQIRGAIGHNSPSDVELVNHYACDVAGGPDRLPAVLDLARGNPQIDEVFVELAAPDLARYSAHFPAHRLSPAHSLFDRYMRWTDNEAMHPSEAEALITRGHDNFWAKRVLETAVALVVLLLFLPLIIGAIIAIKLEDGGAIFYRQTRVGEKGRHFSVLKFRSMIENAEKAGIPQWAATGDHRVTRVGRFLRKSRIDELPQLLNVIKGDMALVGPRPERPGFVAELARQIPNYELRHVVRPGLTGWAQISYPYGASIEDARWKTRFDLYYINNWTIWFDLAIIAQTVRVVLLAEGSR